MSPPIYLTPFISVSALLVVLVLAGLAWSAPTSPGAARVFPRTTAGLLILGLFAWLAVAIGLGLGGFYVASRNAVPTIEFGILVPIVLGIALYLTVPAVRDLVGRLPHAWLVGVQLYRAGGAIFLVLWLDGHLPGIFALPAGIGDVLVGVTAPVAAYMYVRHRAHRALFAWNILGLTDLAIALATGFLTTPSRFQMFAVDAPNLLVTQFPLVIIPTFIVPLSILLHLASIARLAAERRA